MHEQIVIPEHQVVGVAAESSGEDLDVFGVTYIDGNGQARLDSAGGFNPRE